MKKKVLITLGSIVGLLLILMIFVGSKDEKEVLVETKAKFGSFKIEVITTGELEAENSEKILGPSGLRMIRVWNVKISKIIPEGTVVDSGDWVATLDKTEATDNLKNIESELEVAEAKYSNTKLDTTLELRGLRDNLINLNFGLEEAKIKLEQSKFEPPATIRQEEINLQKAQRSYEQSIETYKVKVQQANAKMHEVLINLDNTKRKRKNIDKVLSDFEVKAPKGGMVIYSRNWRGNKIKEGDQISAWDPTVAELPDLSSMISKTYVNEIDISKIAVKQKVIIGVDAFPELQFEGEVLSVANIGEQIPGGDAKVFEVSIKLFESDSLLKPAMTTNNSVLIAKYDSVVYVPIEAIFGNDSINWVYKSSGISTIKQQVVVGKSNDNETIIKQGVSADDKLYMAIPKNDNKLELKVL
ncbi:MAG: efflux RND transporter periplasmic adaptor subunit [Salinivirgaceae bacterium]|nr:efflux RND transporter periplasmic adaptor subunit [Salinivirgaceae bacterium]